MIRQRGGRDKKNVKAPLSKSMEVIQKNSIFGSCSDAEMIIQLKGLALDPCKPQYSVDNIHPLWNQILGLRKVMALKDFEIPWRKRKLEQFVKDKLRAHSGIAVPIQQNRTKLRRGQLSRASSVSCLLNTVDSSECNGREILFDSCSSRSLMMFNDTLDLVSAEYSSLEDVTHRNHPSTDISMLVDTDEYVNDSNSVTLENQVLNGAPPLGIKVAIHYLNSPRLDRPSRRQLQSPHKSVKFTNFLGDNFQRRVVPVGPRFQADVPEWSEPVNMSCLSHAYIVDSDNSMKLGTRIWPHESVSMKTTERMIGRGRPNSCSCRSPGSVDCIRRHVTQKRLLLQRELGSTFFNWKFDEMGEQVSKSWTLKEQQNFELVVKKKPLSNGKDFFKHALKLLSNKCRKDFVSYYLNVYVPQCMSLQTRLQSTEQVHTDDDMDDSNYLGLQKGKNPSIKNFKDAKVQSRHRASSKEFRWTRSNRITRLT